MRSEAVSMAVPAHRRGLGVSALEPFFAWIERGGAAAMPALALLNGILLTRAFAPADVWPVVYISIPVMVLMIWRAPTIRQAFALGWWTGIGFFAIGLSWIGHSFQMQGPNPAVPPALAPVAVFALSAGMSLYIAAAFAVTRRIATPGLMGALVFASAWTLAELARGFLFTGFPWHLLSAVWANWLPPLQGLYWLSSYGLTFVTALSAALLAVAALGSSLWFRTVGPMLALVLMGGLSLAGYSRLEQVPTRYHIGVPMRIVQPNIDQRALWVRSRWGDYFNRQLQMSRSNNSSGRASGIKLLIWPETSIRGLTFDQPDSVQRWQVAQTLEFGAYALVGGARYERAGPQVEYFNSLMSVSSAASIVDTYDKAHLVPFGEYMPLAALFEAIGIRHLTGGAAFTAGDGHRSVRLVGVPDFSPLICYEVVFPGAAFAPGDRPEWLLTITNDGWFGSTEGPHQHLALARMRAVEEGLPMVRSAITGISAVIDPAGRTLKSLGVGRQGVIDSHLPLPLDPPVIDTRTKIWGVFSFALFCLLAALYARKIKKGVN